MNEAVVPSTEPTKFAATRSEILPIPQYSLVQIMLIWAAAAVPMGILGWLVAPALANGRQSPLLVRMAVLTVGLVWQFVLTVILLRGETGTVGWSEFRRRLWLNVPRSPHTGVASRRLWLWLIPLIILTAVYELLVSRTIDSIWSSWLPFLAEPSGFSFGGALATPAARAQLAGAWGTWGLFLVSALFNTVLGEELLFRGLLLPRMAGVFGRWDWVANGLLFSLYHLHQPWMFLGIAVEGPLLYALPSRYFRSSLFGIVAHSGQSVYLGLLLLGLVLGLG